MKKIFLIILIIILVVSTIIFLQRKKEAEQEGRTYGFRDFFTFSTKKVVDGGDPTGENDGDFTDPSTYPTAPGGSDSVTPDGIPIKSAFTNTPPVTPPGVQGPNTPTTPTGPGGQPSGGNNGGGTTPPVLPPVDDEDSDDIPAPLCRIDDLEIEFTADEIAELKALEQEFYALAPTLRSDQDVVAERGNWSNYVFLNENFVDMTNYCEEATPKLASGIKRYLRTPFWNDSRSVGSFVDRTDGYKTIDLNRPSNKYLGYIERFFKLNIW